MMSKTTIRTVAVALVAFLVMGVALAAFVST